MKKKLRRLPDSELVVMQVLWQRPQGMTRPEIDQALKDEREWAVSTVLNLLMRLEEKGFVRREKQNRGYLYIPAVAENAYLESESRSLLGRLYRGNAKNFIAALYNSDALSGGDIRELEEYLEDLKKE